MGDRRFDHRSKSTFKKDIKFGTMLEKYFFNTWVDVAQAQGFSITEWSNNGCDNDGEYIETGKATAGADYLVSMTYYDEDHEDLPLEIKWVPTAGKLTLKEGDLKAYNREDAAILFIYNSVRCDVDLRKPKDYNLDRHIKRIENKAADIKWGIMLPDTVEHILHHHKDRFEPIWYMGNKTGIIINQKEFGNFFYEHEWGTNA